MHHYAVLASMKRSKKIPAHRKQLGDAIRAGRQKLTLSQEGLAEKVGCHRNYVGYVERGEQNVTIDMLVRFATALKCHPANFLEER